MSIDIVGVDTAKAVFQLHGADATGKAVLKRKLHRSAMVPFFDKLPACRIILEACGASHYWARTLSGLGHDVKLIAPEAVRPFVKKGKKNDPADGALGLADKVRLVEILASSDEADALLEEEAPAYQTQSVDPRLLSHAAPQSPRAP